MLEHDLPRRRPEPVLAATGLSALGLPESAICPFIIRRTQGHAQGPVKVAAHEELGCAAELPQCSEECLYGSTGVLRGLWLSVLPVLPLLPSLVDHILQTLPAPSCALPAPRLAKMLRRR